MKLYQKLKEVVMESGMTVVDKAYVCTALDDMACYATTDDYMRFINCGFGGSLELENKQGAIQLTAAVGGLTEYDTYSGGSIHHLDTMFVNDNADVVSKCFRKNGLITDSIVEEAVDSIHSLYSTGCIKTSVPDNLLSTIKTSIEDLQSYAKQEIVWRFQKNERKNVDDAVESKLLDTNVDLFLKLFSDDSRTHAFIVSLLRSMSDEQLKDVYDYL